VVEQVPMTIKQLIQETLKAKESAQAPFSNFKVGAILVTNDNRIYRGCNIETSSFGLTICAERVAIFKAVSEGEKEFKSIFIASDSKRFTPPCGACRQVLWELADDIDVFMINQFGEYQKTVMHELLPFGFDKSFLT
jgi:cytidine deaminase